MTFAHVIKATAGEDAGTRDDERVEGANERDELRALLRWGDVTLAGFDDSDDGYRVAYVNIKNGAATTFRSVPAAWVLAELPPRGAL